MVRDKMWKVKMLAYIRSGVASEAPPTEHSVPATEQPSSDMLSSHSASHDPPAPILEGEVRPLLIPFTT
jgi:hypothetical protein